MLLVRTGLAASTPPIDGHDSDDDQLSASVEVNFTVPAYAVVRLPYPSRASTVKGETVFGVCGEAIPLTTRMLVVAGFTQIPDSDPATDPFALSVAVTDCDPAVFSVTPFVKVWMPLSSPVPLVHR